MKSFPLRKPLRNIKDEDGNNVFLPPGREGNGIQGRTVLTDSINIKELAGTTITDFRKFKKSIEDHERKGIVVWRDKFIPHILKLTIMRELQARPEYKYDWEIDSWSNQKFFDVVPGIFNPVGLDPAAALAADIRKLRFKMTSEAKSTYEFENQVSQTLHAHGYLDDPENIAEVDTLDPDTRDQLQAIIWENLRLGTAPPGAIEALQEAMFVFPKGQSFMAYFMRFHDCIRRIRTHVQFHDNYVNGKKKSSNSNAESGPAAKKAKRAMMESDIDSTLVHCEGCNKFHASGKAQCWFGPYGVTMGKRAKPHPDFNHSNKPFLTTEKGKIYAKSVPDYLVSNKRIQDGVVKTIPDSEPSKNAKKKSDFVKASKEKRSAKRGKSEKGEDKDDTEEA